MWPRRSDTSTLSPMNRPRVLYVMGSLAANDLGEEVVTILGHLPRSEVAPSVVTLGGRDELGERVEEMKIETRSLGLVGPFGTLRAVGKARELIEEIGVDVVHGFGSWGGAVAQIAAPDDVAVVRSVTRPPTSETDLRGKLLRRLEEKAQGRVFATRFVVPNQGSIGLAVRAYGAPDGHVTVLPTSVDVAAVRDRVARTTREGARSMMDIDEDEVAFALVSNFDSGATMDRILTGLSIVRAQNPDLRVFVVGSGRYEGSTRWKSEELGLEDTVAFLGRGTEAGPVWAAADGAIDATPRAPWSRSALLAIAAGVPTVKMQDGPGGWSEELDEPLPMVSGDPERFASDLLRLASDEESRRAIARDNRKSVEDIDVRTAAARLAELYASLAEEAQART